MRRQRALVREELQDRIAPGAHHRQVAVVAGRRADAPRAFVDPDRASGDVRPPALRDDRVGRQVAPAEDLAPGRQDRLDVGEALRDQWAPAIDSSWAAAADPVEQAGEEHPRVCGDMEIPAPRDVEHAAAPEAAVGQRHGPELPGPKVGSWTSARTGSGAPARPRYACGFFRGARSSWPAWSGHS